MFVGEEKDYNVLRHQSAIRPIGKNRKMLTLVDEYGNRVEFSPQVLQTWGWLEGSGEKGRAPFPMKVDTGAEWSIFPREMWDVDGVRDKIRWLYTDDEPRVSPPQVTHSVGGIAGKLPVYYGRTKLILKRWNTSVVLELQVTAAFAADHTLKRALLGLNGNELFTSGGLCVKREGALVPCIDFDLLLPK